MPPTAADSRPEIRIAFVDFWGTFDPRDNYFTRLLEPHYKLVQTDEPDYIIYSCTYNREAPGPGNPENAEKAHHRGLGPGRSGPYGALAWSLSQSVMPSSGPHGGLD